MKQKTSLLLSKTKFNMQLIITLVGLALLMIFFSLNTKNFLSQRNLLNIALQTSVAVLLAIAETFVIITGGIDLSIGSISAASGMIVAVCLNQGVSVPIAVSLGLLTGIALGAFNGFTVTVLGIVPFIATLGTNSIMRGLIYVILNGIPLSASSAGEAFTWIGQSKLGGWLPYPVLFMIIIATVAVIVLAKSRFGRTIFAIGSNENAAFLSGIKVKMTKFKVYLLCGLLSAIAGIILTSRVASASPTAGQGDETFAIAAAVIGGASLSGGKGNMLGTIIGAFIIGILNNGLNLIGLSSFWQQVAVGCVIILAVFLDVIRVKFKNN
ncbi:MAG: ABC transporter permease [Monoglobales bacterium]|jgi:ribose transport system permease protein|uniref:ABC transporter permease n=1 Tax=Candidatus Ventrimonas sp. TaxID=3048889 RepID=UPI0015B2C439